MSITWQFSPMDNWFFRDSKPMNAGESVWSESIFPPTGKTLQGAIRTAILDYKNINYHKFKTDNETQKLIGGMDNLGLMKLTGPWIQKDDITYYPIPLDIVKNKKTGVYNFLTPSQEALECDLGMVKMPAIEDSGYKTIENHFIDKEGMRKLLQGDLEQINNHILPLFTKKIGEKALTDKEPKVGLARDYKTRKVIEGMLFAISPVRPRENVTLAISISGLEDKHLPPDNFLQLLGGEGKLAHIKQSSKLSHPEAQLTESKDIIKFRMILTTHALMTEKGWLPNNFQKVSTKSGDIWQGVINNIPINIITACIGKPFKMGGWNHMDHKARPLISYVPAGSVYFCETSIKYKDQLQTLHNSKIGDQTEYGFGHVLFGKW